MGLSGGAVTCVLMSAWPVGVSQEGAAGSGNHMPAVGEARLPVQAAVPCSLPPLPGGHCEPFKVAGCMSEQELAMGVVSPSCLPTVKQLPCAALACSLSPLGWWWAGVAVRLAPAGQLRPHSTRWSASRCAHRPAAC
jgi:hypothetical protein